jgi:uncharacterized repeat protein (TIGR03806 family)
MSGRAGRRAQAIAALVVAGALAGCSPGDSLPDAAAAPDAMSDAAPPDAGPDDLCDLATGEGVRFDPAGPLCDKLSSFGFFTRAGEALVPAAGLVPFVPGTPLFSDYTRKHRYVWLPPGTAMTYREPDAFAFPVGAVLLKTFTYPEDLRQPDGPERLLETRLLYLGEDGWGVATYVWNEDQSEAHRRVAGDVIPSRWIHTDGSTRENAYSVPNVNECKNCHEEQKGVVLPLGPKARHLHRVVDHGAGPVEQLVYLAGIGYLAGLPGDLAQVPRAPVWDDETTGSLDERARAWLDINCAHCHNPEGAARTSGLDLRASQSDPAAYGVCKPPVAAGAGSGGHQFNIVPGQPDVSILVYRLESIRPDVRMPELGRQLVDEEGVALIRAWIAALEGSCE